MSTYDNYNDSEQYPTCYSHYNLTESGQLTLDGQPISDRQRIRENFIKNHQTEWKVMGQRYRFVRETMHISLYKLSRWLGLSSSVILAFEEGQPVQRPRFVEGAYRAVLSSFFYRHYYSANKFYPQFLQPILKLEDLIANLCHEQTLSLGSIYSLVDTFNFKIKVQWGLINISDEHDKFLCSVNLKEEV